MGQKKLLSVSSSGRVKSLGLKNYSFFALSLNVSFVLMKVFQAHVQSMDFFFKCTLQDFCFVAEC